MLKFRQEQSNRNSEILPLTEEEAQRLDRLTLKSLMQNSKEDLLMEATAEGGKKLLKLLQRHQLSVFRRKQSEGELSAQDADEMNRLEEIPTDELHGAKFELQKEQVH